MARRFCNGEGIDAHRYHARNREKRTKAANTAIEAWKRRPVSQNGGTNGTKQATSGKTDSALSYSEHACPHSTRTPHETPHTKEQGHTPKIKTQGTVGQTPKIQDTQTAAYMRCTFVLASRFLASSADCARRCPSSTLYRSALALSSNASASFARPVAIASSSRRSAVCGRSFDETRVGNAWAELSKRKTKGSRTDSNKLFGQGGSNSAREVWRQAGEQVHKQAHERAGQQANKLIGRQAWKAVRHTGRRAEGRQVGRPRVFGEAGKKL